MLDIKFIRENSDLVKAGAKKKRIDVDIDKLLSVDEKRRALLHEVEEMRAKQNKVSDEVVNADSNEKKNVLISEMRI
ncbi:serine--tRNA ligase, partial [Candidatus Parcubacteria bacterium]|nr:serine--tRNA ligase [Candidatus Parcubacteria bacterium]